MLLAYFHHGRSHWTSNKSKIRWVKFYLKSWINEQWYILNWKSDFWTLCVFDELTIIFTRYHATLYGLYYGLPCRIIWAILWVTMPHYMGYIMGYHATLYGLYYGLPCYIIWAISWVTMLHYMGNIMGYHATLYGLYYGLPCHITGFDCMLPNS